MTKFKAIVTICILVSLNACNLNDSPKSDSNKEIIATDSAISEDALNPVWRFDCMTDSIYKSRELEKSDLSVDKLIDIINANYIDKVKLDFVKLVNDTVFVKIGNSEYLTQRMGSAGSTEYMITTTFTLTEINGVDFVKFDFDYGDHASPGTYSRQYFLDWIESNRK